MPNGNGWKPFDFPLSGFVERPVALRPGVFVSYRFAPAVAYFPKKTPMIHDCRHVHGWFLWVDIYANRTKAEAYMVDFMETAFRPDISLDKLKAKVEAYILTLPAAQQKRFTVDKRYAGRIGFKDPIGIRSFYRLHVSYNRRRVMSISEPTTKEFHVDRRPEDLH